MGMMKRFLEDVIENSTTLEECKKTLQEKGVSFDDDLVDEMWVSDSKRRCSMDQRIKKLHISAWRSGRHDTTHPDDDTRLFPARLCVINRWIEPQYTGSLASSIVTGTGVVLQSQGGETLWDPEKLDVDYSNEWLADYNCELSLDEPLLFDFSKCVRLERDGEIWKDVDEEDRTLFCGVPVFGSSYGGQGITIDVETSKDKLFRVFGLTEEALINKRGDQ